MAVTRYAVLLMLAAAPALAQGPRRQQPAPAPSGMGSLRGIVYDSMVHGPLEGAHVIVGTLSATTDAGGRFHIDSVPAGRATIFFVHPDLDSAGLPDNARRIEITPGRPTVVELDVPSLETMFRAACGVGGVAHASADSGVVFGFVEDIGTHARLSGARVSVSWVAARLGAARVEVTRPGIELRTDSVGNYYACGVPKDYVITASATAGRFQSGLTELLLGERGIARRDLGISRDTGALAQDTGNGKRGRATLIGTVLDEQGNPRAGARASVDDAFGEAFSNEDGQFVLKNMPAGSQMAMVRIVGYSAVRQNVMLRNGDTTRITMRVNALTVLDTIRVTGGQSRMAQFNLEELEHRLRTGSGYVLRGEEVKHRASMRAVVQGLPSLIVSGRSTFDFNLNSFTAGKYWPVTIYVDGFSATTESIQSYRPDQLIAVEWYPRGAEAPVRYQSMDHPDSGVLLLWTRFIR